MAVRTFALWATCALVFLAPAATAEPVTTGTLIEEMIDLHRLAEFPNPAYRVVQFSSFDHRSQVPGGVDWFANSDGFGGEPVPNFEAVLVEPNEDGIGEYLICAVDGPGAIVRSWTAAIAGSVRVYLDGSERPLFDGSADEFLRRPYDAHATAVGTDAATFVGSFYQQNAAYCPIPFADGCRIVWRGDVSKIHFYEVQIRLYDERVLVRTFRPSDLTEFDRLICDVAEVLRQPSQQWDYSTECAESISLAATVAPRSSVDLLTIDDGTGALEMLELKLLAPDVDRALRQTILHIHCDGAPHGQVQSPLGDFFGAAPGVNPFDALPFSVTADGTMTCRFIMPFKESLGVRIENRGPQTVSVSGRAIRIPYAWDDTRSMHFRARWRVDHGLVGDPQAVQDLPFLLAQGRGRYVGTTSLLLNPTDVPSPAGGWWGEGDEKIFVDDDLAPSTFGTGSEDYYNYAWSIPDIFGYAYCGQPRNDGPGNRGFVTNQRWHILDSLPFQNRLAFYMELYPHRRVEGFSYARVAYHYAHPSVVDDHVLITDEDVRPLDLSSDWQPLAWWGAGNSQFHEPEALLLSAAEAHFELCQGNLYSDGRLFLWQPGEVGEQVTFAVPIAEDGLYALDLCALRSGKGGQLKIELTSPGGDSEAVLLNEAVDLAEPGRHMLRRISHKPLELKRGSHALRFTFLGEPQEEIGIDFIWVQKK